ncbi:hypothetical protein [Alicyclobacillus tolerans]|uniref:Uncharacterized protein n=1 Tax=Alicyclobacillus tolerans TaxID=90970 RepID=A0ABT9LY73_9BACL|nr:hypothetical protein [Alicyclobacillus tengchongensis]MDP9729220.1 hypothetical protein [Alicyclobacillus tengchongensis]
MDSGTRTIDLNRYLLLNDNQPYSIEIDSKHEVKSFYVFFTPGYVDHAVTDMIGSEDWLLDNPFYSSSHVELIDKTYLERRYRVP